MKKFELLIAGGGLTAARAIKAYRERGGGGRIALLGKETALPYHRPALSKRYLRGEATDAPFVEDEAFYGDHDVELLLGTPVDAVDVRARTATAAGATYGYDKLLIATGAQPRRLNVPGVELDGVHTLRTLADSGAIRDAAAGAERAVVVGGGFIGMEVAASLRALGVAVTLIDVAPRLFAPLGSEQLSDELADLYRENGVEVLLEASVSEFEGRGRLEAVTTGDGRRIDADLAVVGIGVLPSVDFLADSGLQLENGIVVDEGFAAAPGVFAAGDVANFFDPLFGRRRRIEHWSNANYQGSQVGAILAGDESARYDAVSSFFTEIFGISLKVFGDVARFDSYSAEGSLADGKLVALYGERGRLVGALGVGQDEATEARLTEAIAAREPLTAERSQVAV